MKVIQKQFRLPALALSGLVLVATSVFAQKVNSDTGKQSSESGKQVGVTVNESTGSYTSFAPVVKKVALSVVKVVSTSKVTNEGNDESRGLNDPFWRHFFGDPFGPMMPNRQLHNPLEHGLGSGV